MEPKPLLAFAEGVSRGPGGGDGADPLESDGETVELEAELIEEDEEAGDAEEGAEDDAEGSGAQRGGATCGTRLAGE